MRSLVFLFTVVLATAACAQQYSAFFRYDSGTRVDYSAKDPKGAIAEDSMASSAILHVLIPQDSATATISLAYGREAEGRKDQTYTGVVVHRTPDMITIVCTFGDDVDKVETYVIFPQKKLGFATSHSAYLGRPLMTALASASPQVPFGSAGILRLRQFEQ